MKNQIKNSPIKSLEVNTVDWTITINGKSHEWMLGDDAYNILIKLEKGNLKGAISQTRKISNIRKNVGEVSQPQDLDNFVSFLETI